MKLRVLLGDDKCSERKDLSHLLQSFEDVQVVGEASNALEAHELISNLDYSVIFLDIVMPCLDVIDLTQLLQERMESPIIIYTTAQEEYAIAFAVDDLDYLLKPIHPKRLEEALIKVSQLKDTLTKPMHNPQPPVINELITPQLKSLEVIPVEQAGKIKIIPQDEIIFVYTDKDKVYIKTQKDSYPTSFTIRELEARLNSTLFFRSHRCFLVNFQRMKEIIPYFNGTYTIVVDDNESSQIPLSRTKSRILKGMLGI